MRGLVAGFSVLLFAASIGAASTVREVRARSVSPAATLPHDLTSPEGKSRWHLEDLPAGAKATAAIGKNEAGFYRETPTGRITLSGPDAEAWLLPDHDRAQMKMGARVTLTFDETKDGLVDHLRAEIQTIGIGWLHLPAAPHEVVLERVLLFRQRAGEHATRPDLLIHRWVSATEGVVAEIAGPASADGRSRLATSGIEAVDAVLIGAADLKIYADQIYRGNFQDIKYGYNKGNVPISSLVPNPGVNNACDLVNLPTWNFSGINSGQETATTETPSTAAETCNAARCGYQGYPPSATLGAPILERLDTNLTGIVRKDNQIVQRENRATDVTFWLRAGTQNENASGGFGAGESRFCFTDEAGKPRNEVPLWQMTHNDANGWYTMLGDSWSSVPVTGCQETFYPQHCGANQPFPTPNTLWGKACTDSGQTYAGAQTGKIVKAGVVTLPSGHTLNSLVVRNSTEFCVHLNSTCGFLVDTVRTIVYYWQAPFVGSVALIRGPQTTDFAPGETGESPCTNFTSVTFTDMSYGLLPPVSITAGTATDTTVQLSWNPGTDTHRLSGYKIYWDTDPGASTPYAFNSVANAGQVSIVGTTATISGLTAGTAYYFTVTSRSSFTDPSTGVVTAYESIRYPTTVAGDPNFSYPVEVTKTTTGGTCVPSQEVTGLTVAKANPNVHVCWAPTADACAAGYDVLGSDDATSDSGWSVVGQVGLTTCWDGNPSQRYLLVRARGTGGNGPWGHYSH